MKHVFKVLICLFLLGMSLFLYSTYIGTKKIIIKEYRIKNENIEKNFNGIKIVHFSDIHYGTTIKEKEMQNIVKKINETNPDLVVFTGDLFENTYKINDKEVETITAYFKQIKATLGKYAIKGEDDNQKEYFETILKNSDFIHISDTFDYIYYKTYTPMLLSGLSSTLANKKSIKEKIAPIESEITEYRQNNNRQIFSILLLHEPDTIDQIDIEKYNVILAGHSHNGQIAIPYIQNILLEKGAQKYYKNYYQIKKTDVFISSGLGTSTYPYRLGNKPSISVYRLEAK